MSKLRCYIADEWQWAADMVRSVPQSFDSLGRLIHDGRNKVRLFEHDGRTFVVKRYKIPMFHQRVAYTFFRPSKAKRAYDYAIRLTQLGIATPESVACIEEYSGGLFRTGYFISTCCDWQNLSVLATEDAPEGLLDAFAEFLVAMHNVGFMHGDLNLTNILWQRKPAGGNESSAGGYEFSVIDINRSAFSDNLTREQCLKNLFRASHIRPLLSAITARYAALRGWDERQSVDYVIRQVEQFERKRSFQRKLKRCFQWLK